jgi:hypothetical protein
MTVLLELIPWIPDYGLTNRAPLSGLFVFTPRMLTPRPRASLAVTTGL